MTTLLGDLALAGGLLAGLVTAVLVVLLLAVAIALVRVMVTGRHERLLPAQATRTKLPAGIVGVTPSRGFVPWLIRTVTRGPVAHAFITTGNGDEIVEGDPHGARRNRASQYRRVYWLLNLTAGMTAEQGVLAAGWAIERLGTPYSWLDDLAIGLVDLFGWAPACLRRRLASSRTLMCSQLVDAALEFAGWDLFTDGRPSGGVSPNDLFRLDEQLAAARSFRTISGRHRAP